ncbi:MAG TPA: GNAT family N-acetyltransferase [Alphaproteobacteria bacterium]|nr:GNAT family N-acetyltransferase [Alphaproteobacteria bacterium]
MSGIVVERAEGPTDAVRLLIGELDAELLQHYPPEQRHGLKLDAIFQPHVLFFTAALDGEPAGCGGIALFADFAELKRMYVRPEARGRGVADAILARLAEEASGAGLSLLRLETGTQQQAAIRFYRRAGFMPCGSFEPYASMLPHEIAASVFLEMHILGKSSSRRHL